MKSARHIPSSELNGLGSGDAFVGVADLNQAMDKVSLIDPIARALDFPDYYGQNWDSFEECVGDLDWITQVRVVLVLKGITEATRRLPSEVGMLDEILQGAIEAQPGYGKTLDVLAVD